MQLSRNGLVSFVIGLFIFLSLIGRFFWALFRGIGEDVMVLLKLMRRPPSGRAVWRWRKLP